MDSPNAKENINPAKEYFGALYANISAWHTSIGGLKDGVHNFLLNSVRVNITDEEQLVGFFKKLGWPQLLQSFDDGVQQLFVLLDEEGKPKSKSKKPTFRVVEDDLDFLAVVMKAGSLQKLKGDLRLNVWISTLMISRFSHGLKAITIPKLLEYANLLGMVLPDKEKKREQLFNDFFSILLAPPTNNQLQAKDIKDVKKSEQRSEARAAHQRETESIVKELFSEYSEPWSHTNPTNNPLPSLERSNPDTPTRPVKREPEVVSPNIDNKRLKIAPDPQAAQLDTFLFEAGVSVNIPPIKSDLRVSAQDVETIADRAAAKASSFVVALLLDMGILPIRGPSPPAISNYSRPSPSPSYIPSYNAGTTGSAKCTYNSYQSSNNNNYNKRTPPTTTTTTTSSLFNSRDPIILDEDLEIAKRAKQKLMDCNIWRESGLHKVKPVVFLARLLQLLGFDIYSTDSNLKKIKKTQRAKLLKLYSLLKLEYLCRFYELEGQQLKGGAVGWVLSRSHINRKITNYVSNLRNKMKNGRCALEEITLVKPGSSIAKQRFLARFSN